MTEAPGSSPGLPFFSFRRPGRALVLAAVGLVATIAMVALAPAWRSPLVDSGAPAWTITLVDIVLINLPMVLAVIAAWRVAGVRRRDLDRRTRIEARGLDVLLGLALAATMRGIVELVVPTSGGLGGALLDADAATVVLGLVVLVIGYVLVSPIVEELFFRGLTQGAITQLGGCSWLARAAAIAVSTAMFVLVHIGPIGVTPTGALVVASIVVGIGCGSLVAVTGRVTGAVVAHVAFNGSGVILLLA
ncbi:CPBP family intramembrane glutamic endopeptidase [Microbacterium xanthum]|uniref:CPBP family intramembrane glutamic endopeptidase n=1 Tax=Microbacterium xanthum TaxID=3079794 RepID=UPI002AD4DD8A|nr:CPBP family glutamic-type intramembrane protease [Microbacterium sp. KSW-48]MDZ8170838.1 CPBP family glutamic-type intramembrane protease [Microbacterium sp. KSW-48]